MPTDPSPPPRGRHRPRARDRARAPRRARRRRAVAAGGHPRPGHGVVGGLPLRRQPRRAAHPAARRRLRRAGGCRRRGGRRGGRPAPGTYAAAGRGARVPGLGGGRAEPLRPALRQPGARLRRPARGDHRAGDPRHRHPARPGRRGGGARARCPTGRRRTTHPSRWPPTCGRSGPRSGSAPTRPCCRAPCCSGPRVVGGTSLEVFGQYGADTFRDPSQAYDQQVRMALAVLRGDLTSPDLREVRSIRGSGPYTP